MVATKSVHAPIALIMAGGSGSRFWPMSKKHLPKQFLNLTSSYSLIQETVQRVRPLCNPENIFIASEKTQLSLIQSQLPEIKNLILEPLQKNTAACLMLAVSTLLKREVPLDTPLMVFPADHTIGNPKAFHSALTTALQFVAQHPALITFGIPPTLPHTGYGYIEIATSAGGGIFSVRRFTEKPNLETAIQFLKDGNFFWNSGIFVWTLRSIVGAFESLLSDSWSKIHQASSETELANVFKLLPSHPIDTAVLEKAPNVFVLPVSDLQWSDLGSWSALFDLKAKSPQDNVCLKGQVRSIDSQGCLIQVAPDTELALVGLKDLVIVQEGKTLLILPKNQDQKVKDISQQFEG